MKTTPFEYDVLRELRQLKEMVSDLQAQHASTNKAKPAEKFDESKFLTIKQLMQRWDCKYTTANSFAHRKGSGAIKPKWKILIPIKEVERHERNSFIKTGK